jgi:hypothetical protein
MFPGESKEQSNFPPNPEKEKQDAQEEISQELQSKLEKLPEMLEKNPEFSAKGRKFKVETAGDFLVAETQKRGTIIQEMLEKYKGQDYEREKIAAKLEYFFKTTESFFKAYVELKEDYAPLAQIIEEQYPELAKIYAASKEKLNERNDQPTS